MITSVQCPMSNRQIFRANPRHSSSLALSATRNITLLFLLLGFASSGWCGRIVYPWRATTSIVKSGDSFEVWFAADPGQTVSSVILRGHYHAVSTPMTSETDRWEYDAASQNTYNTKLTIQVPRAAPAVTTLCSTLPRVRLLRRPELK